MFPVDHQALQDEDIVVVRAETQGWRPGMEDFVLVKKVLGISGEIDDIFGIFDGHGGYLVSMFCKVIFPEVFVCNLEKISCQMQDFDDAEESQAIKHALKKSIQDMDNIL